MHLLLLTTYHTYVEAAERSIKCRMHTCKTSSVKKKGKRRNEGEQVGEKSRERRESYVDKLNQWHVSANVMHGTWGGISGEGGLEMGREVEAFLGIRASS